MLEASCVDEGSSSSCAPLIAHQCTPCHPARHNRAALDQPYRRLPEIAAAAATIESQDQRWEKVLWKKQPYPDNYTDGSFLKELVINADVPRRSYWRVVLGSLAISQQLSLAVVSITIPAHLHRHLHPHLHPHVHRHPTSIHQALLLAAAVLTIAAGYVTAHLHPDTYAGNVVGAVDNAIRISAGTHLTAPLLRLSARALGRDSLISSIVFLLLFHLYFYNYNFKASAGESMLGAASVGAAVLSSILAATFITNPISSFLYVLLSTLTFLVSPFPRQALHCASTHLHLLLSFLLASTSLLLLAALSSNLTTVLLMAQFFIVMLCPWWLVRIQKFKAKINGPWDEAVPRIPTTLGHKKL